MRARTKTRGKPSARARRSSPLLRRDRLARMKAIGSRAWWALRGAAVGLAAAACLYGIYLGVGLALRHPSLSIRSIQVKGCRSLKPEAVMAASGLSIGEPLVSVNLRQVQRRILMHPWIKEAVVGRRLPDEVSISIHERSPLAAVPGSGYAVVDREGVVLFRSDSYPGNYPLVTGVAGGGAPGQRLEAALPALRVLESMASSGYFGIDRVSEASSQGDGRVLVSLVGSGTVLVMTAKGAEAEIRRLGSLIQSERFDAQAAGYDLRFEGRVVQLPDRDSFGTGARPVPGGRDRHGQG